MDTPLHEISLDTLCASLCALTGIEPPKYAASPNEALVSAASALLNGKKADRVLMYNPDAVASWIQEKYACLMPEVTSRCPIRVPMRTVMPSVTPVCFGTMYTGAQPEVHGIRKYEKPVIRIDTIFDALLRQGRKTCIVADDKCSMGKIFLERDMDYFLYPTIEEINAKAFDLIREDRYDFICVYNGNYDSLMHKHGPEGLEALAELRCNARTFGALYEAVKTHWTGHSTLLGFAMDHGCHEIDGDCGAHGLDMPEDLNITHYYTVL